MPIQSKEILIYPIGLLLVAFGITFFAFQYLLQNMGGGGGGGGGGGHKKAHGGGHGGHH